MLLPTPHTHTHSACSYTEIIRAIPLGIGRDPTGGDDSEDALLARFGEAPEAAAGGVEAEGGTDVSRRRHRRRCHLISSIEVSVTSSDQSLTLETRESYTLDVAAPAIIVQVGSLLCVAKQGGCCAATLFFLVAACCGTAKLAGH